MPRDNQLRSEIIRLAGELPKGDSTRKALLDALATDKQGAGKPIVGPAIERYDPAALKKVCDAFAQFLIGDPNGALNRMKSIGNPGVYPITGNDYLDLFGRLPQAIESAIVREFKR